MGKIYSDKEMYELPGGMMLMPVKEHKEFLMFRLLDPTDPQKMIEEFFIAPIERTQKSAYDPEIVSFTEDSVEKSGRFFDSATAKTAWERLTHPLYRDGAIKEFFEPNIIR